MTVFSENIFPHYCENLPEAVLEPPRDILQVPHSTGTGGLSSLSLQAPVVRSELGGRVTTLSTSCDEDAVSKGFP